jgi:phage terminase small subunit
VTPKQEAFARAYVETSNASEAYRRSYNIGSMSQRAVEVEASKLLKHPEVTLRLEQLQRKAQKRHEITLDTITEMLKADRELARQNGQPAAAVSAAMGLAKIHGLIVDKAELTHKTSVEDLSDAELADIARASGRRAATSAVRTSQPH